MQKKIIFIFSILCLSLIQACEERSNDTWSGLEAIEALRDEVKQKYAPDGRIAIFNIDLTYENGVLIISGETDQHFAIATFMNNMDVKGVKVEEKISVYPDKTAFKYGQAVVNNSVANLRTRPSHSAELASQVLLGTILKVLHIEEEWYLVQSPDGYIAWVDHGGVELKDDFRMRLWNESKKVIMTNNVGYVYRNQSLTGNISDLVLGNILSVKFELDKCYNVAFPDGTDGYVSKTDVQDYEKWLKSIRSSPKLLEYTARSLMGSPYLWGGTSAKGMDCSGFTKTIYFLNGLVIPRDASQQVNEGEIVDEELKFEGLKTGDLLFFGKPKTNDSKRKVTHVGMWIGHGQFIHASRKVRVSSVDPDVYNYDEFNKNRYLGSRRYLSSKSKGIINLVAQINQSEEQ